MVDAGLIFLVVAFVGVVCVGSVVFVCIKI